MCSISYTSKDEWHCNPLPLQMGMRKEILDHLKSSNYFKIEVCTTCMWARHQSIQVLDEHILYNYNNLCKHQQSPHSQTSSRPDDALVLPKTLDVCHLHWSTSVFKINWKCLLKNQIKMFSQHAHTQMACTMQTLIVCICFAVFANLQFLVCFPVSQTAQAHDHSIELFSPLNCMYVCMRFCV